MASELRVNTSTNRVGLGTITYTDTGPIISGITTGNNFKTGTTNVHSTGVELANINTGGSTATFGGDLSIPDTIVHTGDTNTKIRFPAADQIQLETGGTARVTVTNSTTTVANNATFSGTTTQIAGNYLDIQDNKKLRLGTDGDCAFYFNGSATLIETGNKIIHMQTDASIRLQKNSPQAHMLIANAGGSVDLYHNGTKKLETDADGIRIGTGGGDNTIVDLYNASYDNGVIQYYNGSVALKTGSSNGDRTFQVHTAGSERLRITSAGKLGLGITTPDSLLHIHDGSAGSIASSSAAKLTIESSASDYSALQFLSPATAEQQIRFGDASDNGAGYIAYNHGSNYFAFGTAGPEKVRIDSLGNLLVGTTTEGSTNTQITVAGSGNAGVTIRSGTSSWGCLYFSDATSGADEYRGAVQYNQTSDYLMFRTATQERIRITSTGELRIGATGTTASTAGDDLVIEGSSDRGLSIIAGSGSSSNIYFGHSSDADEGRIAYQHNDNALDFSVNAGTTRVRIHQSGTYHYGNDNIFYGGTSGTNLNGELTIRSTGTAVYQHLRFKSSDGSSQSQVMGYGGGAILFHYSNEFVWAINNQGERLNLTNTSLRPRDTSTVLDLGTTTRRYRRTYTDGITVNTTNTNTKFCINGGSSSNVMTIRNTTLGNGHVGILFSTQDHSGGREKAAIYHQETHGTAHYGGDFVFCLNTATGGATQVSINDERFRMKRSGDVSFGDNPHNALWSATNHAGTYYRKGQGSLASATRANTGYSSYYINKNTGAGGSSDTRWVDFYWNTNHYGRISYNGASGTTYGTSSDYRLKENAVSITDGIEKVKQLKPYRFNFISDSTDKVVQGFFAHEAQDVVPYAVTGTKDEVVTQEAFDEGSQPEEKSVGDPIYQDVDYAKFTPILTAALQEAIAKIEVLEAKVSALESS